MKVSNFVFRAVGSFSIAFLALACGNAANPTTSVVTAPVQQISCSGGLVPVNNVCMQPAATLQDFQRACPGRFDLNARTCQFDVVPGLSPPILLPSVPSGPAAFNTLIPVKVGDQVSVSNSSGGYKLWSSSQSGIFTTYSCNSSYDLNGIQNGTQSTNEGLNSGLVGSDGTRVFYLGASGSTTVQTNGKLLLGINSPSATQICGLNFMFTVTVKFN